MKEIDAAIRQSVSKEDAEFLAKLEGEPSSMQQVVGVFQGPFSAIYKLFFIAAIFAGIAAVYSGWRFASASELRPLFYWGALTAFCVVVIATVRITLLMQMNTNRMLREFKRLELQIALLVSKGNA